jgi:hypothetical protein
MFQASAVSYSVPTHLQQREPFAFGRTLGEVARLVAVGFVTARLLGSDDVPSVLRVPAAGAAALIGVSWALLRIQRRTLDDWVALAFRYSATPRRRVWQPGASCVATDVAGAYAGHERGWYQVDRVRVRWAKVPRSEAATTIHAVPGSPDRTGGSA